MVERQGRFPVLLRESHVARRFARLARTYRKCVSEGSHPAVRYRKSRQPGSGHSKQSENFAGTGKDSPRPALARDCRPAHIRTLFDNCKVFALGRIIIWEPAREPQAAS